MWSGSGRVKPNFLCIIFRSGLVGSDFWVKNVIPSLAHTLVGSGRIFLDGSSSGRTAHDQVYGRYKNTNS